VTEPTPATPEASPPAEAVPFLRRRDRDAITALAAETEIVSVHPNESHWWNDASFALPLVGSIVCVAIGWFASSAELLGFGAFLGFVTLAMFPVVQLSWRNTPTAIVLTSRGALALHAGRVLREVQWTDLASVDRIETMGNVRWRLQPWEGQHLAVDGEIADVPGLVAHARALAGLPEG